MSFFKKNKEQLFSAFGGYRTLKDILKQEEELNLYNKQAIIIRHERYADYDNLIDLDNETELDSD